MRTITEELNEKNYFTTVSEDNKEDLYRMSEGCDALLKDIEGETIVITEIMCNKFRKTNADGTTTDKMRTVVKTEDGKIYLTMSWSAFYSLEKIYNIFGLPCKVSVITDHNRKLKFKYDC